MFPDISNVLHIREALFRHKALGSASIMVGAGFSRNAEPTNHSARPMPDWSQMAAALCDPLYPTNAELREHAMREASATSGFLRMAQEYRSAFGASSLNYAIKNLVPDMDYLPGDLHKRLLRLPWADVFTTNWDTLLERACVDVIERSYDVVRTLEEVPFTMRPRIVKLHGTFPSYEPFIFTEDDYRTYPVKFAPFVNLVQQSMMETIFCLVGFSGDDPNFLNWAGWVRDNLGPSAPKIYLVGWLSLSVHRRRMLEERNVMPIDIANLPEASAWPDHLKHHHATEWFIRALEAGRPYNILDWPRPPSNLPPDGGPSLPVNPSLNQSPWQELTPGHDDDLEINLSRLREAAGIWEHNRKVYPGWLIAPEYVREHLWQQIRNWASDIQRLLPHLNVPERIFVLYECMWRSECALLPLFNDVAAFGLDAIRAVDLARMDVPEHDLPEGKTRDELAKACILILENVARTARHDGEEEIFQEAIAGLALCAISYPEADNIRTYELILQGLGRGKTQGALQLVSAWRLGADDPVWALRKAGIISELGDQKQACELLEKALVQIRKTRHRDTDDIPSLSRESWALYFGLAFTHDWLEALPRLSEDLPRPRLRWRELAIVECDAMGEYQLIKRSLESGKDRQPDVTTRRTFDLDREQETYHFAQGPSAKWLAAIQMVHLAEQTGVPGSANRMSLFKEALTVSAIILKNDECWLTAQLVVRQLQSMSESEISEIYNRTQIATLPLELVSMLRDACLERIDEALNAFDSKDDQKSIVRNGFELLSRVALRLNSEDLFKILSMSIIYYKNSNVQGQIHQFKTSLSNLLSRTMEALNHQDLEDIMPTIFSLPLPSGSGSMEFAWAVEPSEYIPDDFQPTGISHSDQWRIVISGLLSSAIDDDLSARKGAIHRLYLLWKWKILTDAETKQFGEALWTEKHVGENKFPSATTFVISAFSSLPHPDGVDAVGRSLDFVANILTGPDRNPYEKLKAIAPIFGHIREEGKRIDLNLNISELISNAIKEWSLIKYSSKNLTFLDGREDRREIESIRSIRDLMNTGAIHVDNYSIVFNKIKYLDSETEHDARGYELYSELFTAFAVDESYFNEQILIGLLSDRKVITRAAVQGLFYWLYKNKNDASKMLDLVKEIGIAIAARRLAILRSAIELAIWIFKEGSEIQKEAIAANVIYGLGALLTEASYQKVAYTDLDIPSIRAACVRLAFAMKKSGHSESTAIKSWLEAASSDPLPEVRNAITLHPDSQLVDAEA